MKVSRTMSTQHPDNVRQPFFADNSILKGEDEIKEAFYAFSHLNSTLRIPNPDVEKADAKILLETLESIPRSFDVANHFYGNGIAPIFEVALPMTGSGAALARVAEYYKQIVVGKKNRSLVPGDIKISDWIGDFQPEEIRLIPLIETKEAVLKADNILADFLALEKIKDYQRVWLARSDPALNYGNISAILMVKVALQRLHDLQEEESIEILPIIGCGSAPFRGNLKPTNADMFIKNYPSVQTYTIQSAFKYDYDEKLVRSAVEKMNAAERKAPIQVDENRCRDLIERQAGEYRKQVTILAPLINDFAKHVPSRRARKLHIGLFGYSRKNETVELPRAISFCASLYSLGLPPELLGMNAFSDKDIDFIRSVVPGFDDDMADALAYVNKDNLGFFPKEIITALKPVIEKFSTAPDARHQKITSIIMDDYRKKNLVSISEDITRAGLIRGFLG